MHSTPTPDNAGDFKEWAKASGVCPACDVQAVKYRDWESSCGGLEDTQYKCDNCGHSWWVEGIDS